MTPGFSERTFEFCFNAEFCNIFGALLASHPHIPSQQIEKDLGYDVEFRLGAGGFSASLFLQHKVAHFAASRAGKNASFYDHHSGAYFRFAVDNHQHNTLHELSRTKGNAFYCAPRFHLRHELEAYFRAVTVAANSLLFDPMDVGDITDTDRHNITYSPAGANPTLHSEPKSFRKAFPVNKDAAPQWKRHKIDKTYFEELSDELTQRTADSKFKGALTPSVQRMKPVEKAQYLLGHVYDVTWLLLP